MPLVLADPTRGRTRGDRYGSRPGLGDGFHGGIDFPGEFPVYAAADGVVIPSNYDSSAGNSIIIRHSQHGICTGYAHLKAGSLLVSPNQTVRMGQQIATSNNSGFSTGSHLHFEVIPGTTGALAGNGSQNHNPDQWIDYNLDPSTPTPIPEEDMSKTLIYRAPNGWQFVANVATGLFYPLPDAGTEQVVRSLPGFLDDGTRRDLSKLQMIYLGSIINEATDGSGKASAMNFVNANR